MFAVNMLVNTESGDNFSFNEIKRWLEEAGLKMRAPSKRRAIPAGAGDEIVVFDTERIGFLLSEKLL